MKKSFFTARNALLAFLIFLLMYALINFKPFGLARLHEITGGPSILDMEMQGYTADKAYEILNALGDEGRAYDLNVILPLDIPFPIAYSLFYFITLTLLAKRNFTNMKRPWLVGLIGLPAGCFDLLENVMIFVMLKNYPVKMLNVAQAGNVMTLMKANFTMISMGLILLGLILLGVKRLARKPVAT